MKCGYIRMSFLLEVRRRVIGERSNRLLEQPAGKVGGLGRILAAAAQQLSVSRIHNESVEMSKWCSCWYRFW